MEDHFRPIKFPGVKKKFNLGPLINYVQIINAEL